MNSRICLSFTISLVLLFNQQVDSTSNRCSTPQCLQAAAKIIDYIDENANPCEDFHQFVCGNFLKNAHTDEGFSLPNKVSNLQTRQLLEIYREHVREDDHKMVKAAKNLFHVCVDDRQLNRFEFRNQMWPIIQAIGGWPAVEGSRWNEEKFDWMNATYELRRLGYDFGYSAFIGINLGIDGDKYILRIDPKLEDYYEHEVLDNIARVALLFGASEETVLAEIKSTYKSTRTLYKLRPERELINYEKYTIEEIQESDGIIDWLEFINNIVGPKVQLSKSDYVYFPPNQFLKRVLELLSKIPKRVQANYLVWEALKPAVRFVNDYDINAYGTVDLEEPLPRAEFCLRKLEAVLVTLVPNPVDVIRHRRYHSEEKNRKVAELISDIKTELKVIASKLERASEKEKQSFVATVDKRKVIIGSFENYFDNRMLDDADVDMIEVKNDSSFFALLAQANRNQKSAVYMKLKILVSEDLTKNRFRFKRTLPCDHMGDLSVPSVAIGEYLFDRNRPNYLNFGMIGTIIASELSDPLWPSVAKSFRGSSKTDPCALLQVEINTLDESADGYMLWDTVKTSVAEQISYAAYEAWTKDNHEEEVLVGIDYTAKQLFWISAAMVKCQPVGPSHYYRIGYNNATNERNSKIVSESVRHISNFAKDFNCPVNSKMNPSNRCQLL